MEDGVVGVAWGSESGGGAAFSDMPADDSRAVREDYQIYSRYSGPRDRARRSVRRGKSRVGHQQSVAGAQPFRDAAKRQECVRVGAGQQGLRRQPGQRGEQRGRGARDPDAPPARPATATARSRAPRRSARAWPRIRPISRAFCSPVLASAAGRPVAASLNARSARCAPSAAAPASASLARRGGQARAQPVLHRDCRCVGQPLGDRASQRRCGPAGRRGGPAASAAFSRATRASRAAVAATACRAIASSSPASQAGSRRPCGEQPVALRHCRVVRGDLARMAGLQRPDQPVEEAAPAGGRLLEQPVHLRRQPDGGDPGSDLAPGCAALPRPGGTPAGPAGAVRRRCRCRYRRRPPRWRSGRRPPSRRSRPCRARQVGAARAAQPAPGHQQRNRFQQVGLAAAVRRRTAR